MAAIHLRFVWIDWSWSLQSIAGFFVQDHPNDPTKEIQYIALESGEAGTYTRGSGLLNNGQTTVFLPEHFSLVTSEEGITAQVTLTGDANNLYVVSKSNIPNLAIF